MKKLLAVGWLLSCSLALAAPPLPKATAKIVPDKAAEQIVKPPPNPNGRKGGPEHQAKVNDVAKQVEARGLEPKKELEVAGINPATKDVEEMHQVGVQTKKGQPVAREKDALEDIQKATGKRPEFHPYNQ